MTSPIVSVVMSVFNGERFLREAVESILAQSLRDFEFIIIDDGSTDRSASMLDYYQNSDVRLKVHHREHGGLIESLNRGCALAQGKYIARMDADDVAIKDRLAWQIEFMDAHPEVGVVGGAVEWIDSAGKSLGIFGYPCEDRQIKATLLQGCALWHPTVVLRKAAFVWAGGYRSVFVDGEDYDLWLRIADRFQLANLHSVLLKYRIHPSQVSMRQTKQQTLGLLAAQAAASARRKGLPDPLDSVVALNDEALAALDITPAMVMNRFASYRRDWIRNMCRAGEYSIALEAALEILRSDLKNVAPPIVADLHLIVANLRWRQRRFAKSLMGIGRAIVTWPAITIRLMEAVSRRLRWS